MRVTNTSLNTEFLDVYMLTPGTPIDDITFPQVFGIPSLANSGFTAVSEGMRELTVTLPFRERCQRSARPLAR